MVDSLAGLCLAAGAGTRLRPLTDRCPKPLCPVGNRPLLDWAVESLTPAVTDVAVNVCHHRDRMLAHLAAHHPSVHVSVEEPPALGTAGAVGRLAGWIDGRPLVTVNADTWHRIDLVEAARDWDRERVRLVTVTPGPFGPGSIVVASLLPPWAVARCRAEPSGLWEAVWSPALTDGRAETVHVDGPAVDCGTPADYLRANLVVSGGVSVVGAGAVVEGTVERCVVWPGARVGPEEHLVEVVRADGLTVPAAQSR